VRDQFEQSMRYYQLVDEKGRTVESSRAISALKLPWTQRAQEAIESKAITWETYSLPSGGRLRLLNVPVTGVQQRRYLMRIGISLLQADEDTARLRLFMFALLPFVLLIHAVNSWLVTAKELRPLEQMNAAARQISPLDLSSRFPVLGTGDELDQLSISLNATIARLQVSFQRMSEFLRNLCHEVRQPLTVMRAEAEQALRAGVADQNYREMLSSQLEHVQLLARTVSDLMELAQSDTDEIKLHCQPEDLSELVQSAIDGMRVKASEYSIHISGTVQQNVIGSFDAGQIWRLVLNLLDNAIKYNHGYGRVDVVLSAHNHLAVLSVSDTGCGIAEEERQQVFERGYRAAANQKAVPGTGLGLHFARSIARAHGGDIELTSVSGQGSCFLVSLPLLNETTATTPTIRENRVQ
ncbi:MAG: sensor histidine kinase, partial [Candidatus Angelobacter sp.]